MTSRLLVKARREGREIVNVTPQSAGWTHVGFRALRLAAGDSERLNTGTRELCIVVLAGNVDITAGGQSFDELGSRDSVFDDVAPAALYVPANHDVTIMADGPAEVALCSAPCDTKPRAVRLLDPLAMRRSKRGQGSNTRYICDILPHDDPTAAHLLVVEVRTPAGHSSSYPPHKHDSEAPPAETQLEETYYHRLESGAGLCLPARLHRRPQPRRGDGGGGPRRGAGAARLPPGRRAARLRPVLPQRDGRAEPPLGLPQRPGARVDAQSAHFGCLNDSARKSISRRTFGATCLRVGYTA